MANVPSSLLYTDDHEWVRIEGDVATVGITHHAQDQLGDVVFLGETPEGGSAVGKGDVVGVVESVKATSDIYSPLAGEIVEANPELEGKPELINSDPYGKGWILKIRVGGNATAGLLNATQYAALLEE